MSKPFVSICIPTNGRINILKRTLDSIFIDSKISYSEFEVVLSDNSSNNELSTLLDSYENYPNIVYEKTNCEGFLNSINALKLGTGHFLKLHNNYTMFSNGSLAEILLFVKRSIEEKPLVFFKNSNEHSILKYSSFDEFNYNLSFWNSWSTGFSIWKEDFDKVSDFDINEMFPHTSLFLSQSFKKSFIINDIPYFVNQEVSGKGGYDLFKTFAVDYLKLVENSVLLGHLSVKTFAKIKKDLFFDFLVIWYYNTKIASNDYTFKLENIKESLTVYYSKSGYYKMSILGYLTATKIKIKNIIENIFNFS